MKRVDIVLCPTTKSLTHTAARRNASAAGARVATLPGVTEEIMIRCLSADYHQIARRSEALASLMSSTETISVKSALGTNITLPVRGRKPIANTGIYGGRGRWGNLPAGETFIAPIEGQAFGTVIFDRSIASIGVVKSPVTITIEGGYARDISGEGDAARFVEMLAPHDQPGRNIAEFGIGTNDMAVVSGSILEDEKVMGTIHIALGDNKSMGGHVQVPSHIDGLVLKPNVWFDDRQVIEEGKFLVTL